VRAAVITQPGGPSVLQVQEIEDPVAGLDDVLVDVKASALNRADLMQRQGRYPATPGIRADVPGLEFSGVVTEAGERVTGVTPGDRVCGLLGGGDYASRVATHHLMTIPIPSNLDFVQAAAIPEVFFTAYDALFNHCELKMGESVLIHAVGSGVGTAALQLAHQFKRHVLPLIADARIQAVVDLTFTLEKASDAHEYMETNANFGKIILTID
jgi:NADPH2:quinone reductase